MKEEDKARKWKAVGKRFHKNLEYSIYMYIRGFDKFLKHGPNWLNNG